MGRTELHYRAAEGDVEKVLSQLRAGDPVDATDRDGFTALHLAAQQSHAAVAEVLLRNGAAVDARDVYGNTPLWRAVFSSAGAGDTVEVLIAHGADPDVANRSGVSPRQLADRIATFDVSRYLPMRDG